MPLTDTHTLTHTFTFVSQYHLFSGISPTSLTLMKSSSHSPMLKLSWVECSIMEQQLIIHPGEFILYIQTGAEVSAQSGISLFFVGTWVYSQRSVSVLCYSMCLCLWGGAPWTVNIGQAGEGRSLLCAWHGPVSVSDSLPAESTATIPLRLAPSPLLSSSLFFSSVFFFSLHVLLQNYNLVQPAVKYASVSGWDLWKSSFSDSWFFLFF